MKTQEAPQNRRLVISFSAFPAPQEKLDHIATPMKGQEIQKWNSENAGEKNLNFQIKNTSHNGPVTSKTSISPTLPSTMRLFGIPIGP